MQLLDEAPSLRFKVARQAHDEDAQDRCRRAAAAAHGGSSVAIKSDPFGLPSPTRRTSCWPTSRFGRPDQPGRSARRHLCRFRARDRVDANRGAERRGCGRGQRPAAADIDPQEIGSTIWRLWQGGPAITGHGHVRIAVSSSFRASAAWRGQADGCRRQGVRSDPVMASQTAHLVCPKNGCVITDDARARMNARGVYVAPGQHVKPNGKVVGEAPESWTVSFWVSGLASPFKTWGERAAEYVAAVRSGEPGEIQSVVNGGFGELWAPGGGDVPEWRELEKLKLPYLSGEVPADVRVLTAGVDVQKVPLPMPCAAGQRSESWLIEAGEVFGDTVEEDPGRAGRRRLCRDGHANWLARSIPVSGRGDLMPYRRTGSISSARSIPASADRPRDVTRRSSRSCFKSEVGVDIRGRRVAIGLADLDTDYFKRA